MQVAKELYPFSGNHGYMTHHSIFMLFLGLLPSLLLGPHIWPLLLVRKALVNIHQKDDCDLQSVAKGLVQLAASQA